MIPADINYFFDLIFPLIYSYLNPLFENVNICLNREGLWGRWEGKWLISI